MAPASLRVGLASLDLVRAGADRGRGLGCGAGAVL